MKLPRGSEEHFCDIETGTIAASVTLASGYGVSPVVKAEGYVVSQKSSLYLRLTVRIFPSRSRGIISPLYFVYQLFGTIYV